MSCRMAVCCTQMCIIHGIPKDAWATNTAFLPGDAFFHTLLKTEDLERLETEDSPTFVYALPRHVGLNLCGYAGFWRLRYEQMPESLRKNVIKLARHLRATEHFALFERRPNFETGELEDVEVAPFHLFIYEPAAKGRIGLKYNEHWSKHTAYFYTFAPDVDMIAAEWRDCERMPALEVEAPFELVGGKKPEDAQRFRGFGGSGESWPMGGPQITEPVVIRGPKKCIIVPAHGATWESIENVKPERELINIARMKNGATIYEVTVDGIVGKRAKHGEWVEFDPFADPTESDQDE